MDDLLESADRLERKMAGTMEIVRPASAAGM